MLVVRRDQLQRLEDARWEELRRSLARVIVRLCPDDAELRERALQVAKGITVESGDETEEVARLILTRCKPAEDEAMAMAIEVVLRQPRPIRSRLAFIRKHLLPHLAPSD